MKELRVRNRIRNAYTITELYDNITETVYDDASGMVDVVINLKNENFGEIRIVVPIEDNTEHYDETGQDYTEEYYLEALNAALSAGNYKTDYSNSDDVSISYYFGILYVEYDEQKNMDLMKNLGEMCKKHRTEVLGLTLAEFANQNNANLKNIHNFEKARANNINYIFMYATTGTKDQQTSFFIKMLEIIGQVEEWKAQNIRV